MHKKQLIQLFGLVAVLLFLWWLWPVTETGETPSITAPDGAGEQELVSAIQPISDDGSALLESSFAEEPNSEDTLRELGLQVSGRFQQAQTLTSQGERNAAIEVLESLIANYPKQVEPYINLAALLADQGQLDHSRKILVQGLNANALYATLFSNLQKVNGSLAAKAYRLAKVEDETPIAPLELQYVSKLNLSAVNQHKVEQALLKVDDIKQQLDHANTKLESSNQLINTRDEELERVNAQLSLQQKNLRTQEDANSQSSQNSLLASAAMQQELDQTRTQIENLQRAHLAEVAGLRKQIQQQELLTAYQPANSSDQQAQPKQQEVPDSTQQPAQQTADTAKKNRAAVTDLVRTWARAWSTQQVDLYLEHYVGDYAPPGSSLSHAQWVAQRKLRLANKSFIEVSVSDFDVQLVDGQYRVIFSQHYRSNTMDDTIRKQLKFSADDENWSQSKIVSEQVLR